LLHDRTRLKRYAVGATFAIALLLAWLFFSTGHIDAKGVLAAIHGRPFIGPVVFVLMLILSTMLLLPLGLGLNLGAGIIWGSVLGGLWTTTGSVVAAIIGFLIARYVGERHFASYLARPAVQLFMRTVRRQDWQVIFLVRLNPLIPFGLQNYLLGLTGIPLIRFTLLSVISCAIPGFLYATIGAAIDGLVLTGDLKNMLVMAGAALLLFTIGYLARLYLRMDRLAG
jgi:uncharacterized membrane protein YdjX (TVP38/TMEM64 family)